MSHAVNQPPLQQVEQTIQVTDLGVGRRTARPDMAGAIHPHRAHAGGAGAVNIAVRVVSDMQHLLRRHAGGQAGGLEDAPVRLGDADLAGRRTESQQAVQADARDVGIAVGEAAQRQPCLLYTSPSPRDKRQSRMPSSA